MSKLSEITYFKELVEIALNNAGYQVCDTHRNNWITGEKKLKDIFKNSSIIVEGKYPTKIIHIDKHNNEMEIYMNNGWQVNLKNDIGDSSVISNARLVGVPATNFEF